MIFNCVLSRQSNIVKNAESVWFVSFCVMTRWTDYTYSMLVTSIEYFIDDLKCRANGQTSTFVCGRMKVHRFELFTKLAQ